MKMLYNIGVRMYGGGIRLAAFFSPKAQKWVNGRKDIFKNIAKTVEKGAIWIHVASLGEFEQGRPLIEKIKKEQPKQKILLTFFSPSGYELRKNYALADFVYYLPLDTKHNAQKFIELTQPSLAVFVKYEFWYHYINELEQQKIPLISISTLFRPSQIFFQWYGSWYKKILLKFDHFFVQNKISLDLLKKHQIKNSIISGDTRVDRVWSIKKNAKDFPMIAAFKNDESLLVIGSSWQPDEAIIAEFCKKNQPLPFKIIIAPHEIDDKHIQQIINQLPKSIHAIRYSNSNQSTIAQANILIIDNIGMLSGLYRYGNWAYIGGAFGKGLHNTLEPITFGLPVIFGPKYQKFEEANWLVENGGGFTIQDQADFEKMILKLQLPDFHEKASKKALTYIQNNRGATDLIWQYLEGNNLLKSTQNI